MPVDITMPKLGLTMASGTIARWMKMPGDTIVEGEPLLEVETDKINYEVEAPASGILGVVVARDGEEFSCGTVLGTIALAGEDVAATIPANPATEEPVRSRNGGRVLASPAARRLARERNIPLHDVSGTGPRGRISLSDIGAYAPAVTALSPPPASSETQSAPPPELDRKRRAIYRKMSEVALVPLASVATDVCVDEVRALIERRGDFGWTAYAVYAAARLIQDHPLLRTDASTGTPLGDIDIGVAADTPFGLIVPVVRGANARTLAQIQTEILRLAHDARDGKLAAEDIGRACFSISNVGPQRVDRVTPLVDPPQTAILGMGAAKERATVRDGAVVPAWMMTCVLSFDHRFIDGAPAARFLADLARALEDPGSLL